MSVNLSIKNVPEELVERLRERARRNRRSLQGELMVIIEESVLPRKLTLDEAIGRVRALRLETEEESAEWVRELRDAR